MPEPEPHGDPGRPGRRLRHRPRHRPFWWPENEPWPPTSWPPGGAPWSMHGQRWDDPRFRRRRRRLGCAVIGFLAVMALGFAATLWAVASVFGLVNAATGIHPGFAVLVLVAGGFLFAGLARASRRFAAPVDELLEAADRLAAGDYAIRVPERGPHELRAAAHSLNTLAERLAATEARRRAMFADVSHELRTPLTVVRGGIEGMLDGIHPRDDAHLAALRDEVLHLDRIIDDLRTLSLAEVGTLALTLEPLPPETLAADAVAAFAAQARAAGITLAVEAPAGLPSVAADSVRIGEVLRNLLANALRYTPAGGRVTIAARATPDAVEFTVTDTGAGLEPDVAAHLFERYRRSTDSSGSGLGLAIARALVEAHGGTIRAESAGPDLGTTVSFTVPVTQL